jgi:hypothetical protein
MLDDLSVDDRNSKSRRILYMIVAWLKAFFATRSDSGLYIVRGTCTSNLDAIHFFLRAHFSSPVQNFV